MTKRTTSNGIICLVFAVGIATACGPNQRILESANENTAASEAVPLNSNGTQAVSTFEKDLNAMRTADFKFILVFRRKDGRALTAIDKGFVGKTGSQANRRLLSDEGKAVIIGSNFPFVTGEFKELTERFTMENYSKPDSGPMFSDTLPNK